MSGRLRERQTTRQACRARRAAFDFVIHFICESYHGVPVLGTVMLVPEYGKFSLGRTDPGDIGGELGEG
jgi:hypothetical protein